MTKEQIRHRLSAVLMDTDEQHPMPCNIILDSEAMGLCTSQMPNVVGAFQIPTEGIIYFNIEGYAEPVEFDDLLKEDVAKILQELC